MVGLTLAVVAGLANGSYPVLKRKFQGWSEANIWLGFSVFAFLVLPFLVLLLLFSEASMFIDGIMALVLLVCGFAFALGMISFVKALDYIGLAPSFTLNIGFNTSLGSLLPLVLFYPEKIFSISAFFLYVGISSFIIAVIFLAVAIKGEKNRAYGKRMRGLFYGMFSGVLTSLQALGYSFAHTKITERLGYSDIRINLFVWSIFFIAVFGIYALFFFYKSKTDETLNQLVLNMKNWFLSMFMGVLYFSSIIIFSFSTTFLKMPIAWPIFMASIIACTNLWSVFLGDYQDAKIKFIVISIVFMLLAFMLISIAQVFGL